MRSDGNTGYVFVNNYQRLQTLPEKRDVQFKLNLPGGELVFPQKPVTIPADEFFIWPFNLNLGGAKLIYATAQPICKIRDDSQTFLEGPPQTFYFAETPGVNAEFIFDAKTLASAKSEFKDLKSGRGTAIKLEAANSHRTIQIVLLNEADSLALRKSSSGAKVVFDGPQKADVTTLKTEPLRPAGPARQVPLSRGRWPIALAPTDTDFTIAAVWKITLPVRLDFGKNPRLRIRYIGDVARVTLNGRLLDDNFYSGRAFEIGLKRYAPEILTGDLRLEILPLRQDAPIFLESKAEPDFGTNKSLLKLLSAEIVHDCEVEFGK